MDYKIYCFNGEVKALLICSERQSKEGVKMDFFDAEGNHLPFTQQGHPNAKQIPPMPKHWEEMKSLASQLSQNIPHVRVDFYEANDKIYFGELTFSNGAGFAPFSPEKYERLFGDWINLNTVRGGG